MSTTGRLVRIDPVRPRRGVTLVELLVVIAIIGVLAGLLLPAIEGAREAARRSVCGSKLRDIGTALHAYEARNTRFPAAGRGYSWCSTKPTKTTPGQNGFGEGDTVVYNSNGLVELLPFLNQRNLYDSFDHDSAFLIETGTAWGNTMVVADPNSCVSCAGTQAGRNTNQAIARTYVSEFRCPSDTQPANLGSNPSEATNYDFIGFSASAYGDAWVVTDKLGNTHSYPTEQHFCNVWRQSGTNARMFGQNSCTSAAQVRDGLSNTLAFGETTVWWSPHGCARWANRSDYAGAGIDPIIINNWAILVNGSQDQYFFPRRGVIAHNAYTTASLHPGGLQVLMGDGAVRFLSEQTAVSVLAQLKRMRDGNAPQDW